MLKIQGNFASARFQSKNVQNQQQGYMTKVNQNNLGDTVSFGSQTANIKTFMETIKPIIEPIFGELEVMAGEKGSYISEHLAVDSKRAEFVSKYTKAWFKEYDGVLKEMTPYNVLTSLKELSKIHTKYSFVPENCPDRIEFHPRDVKTLIGTTDSGAHGAVSDLRISNPKMYEWIANGGLKSIQSLGNFEKPITTAEGKAIIVKTVFNPPSKSAIERKFKRLLKPCGPSKLDKF